MEEGGGGAMFPQGEPNPFGGVTGRDDLNMLRDGGQILLCTGGQGWYQA